MELTVERGTRNTGVAGFGQWQPVVTYDPAKRLIYIQLLEGDCAEAADEKLGRVVEKFGMKCDPWLNIRWYHCDHKPVGIYERFDDTSIFSVIANDENVTNLHYFLEDRDDHKSARWLRATFPDFFPKKSRASRLADFIFGR